ncbi:MAG: hypothetical protein R6W75_01840 [Smithellaceae bacterium]
MFRIAALRLTRLMFGAFFILFVFPWMASAGPEGGVANDKVTRVAVVPFQSITPEDASSPVRCPICGNLSSAGPMVEGAEGILEELFTEKLRGMKNIELVPMDRAAGVYHRIQTGSLTTPMIQVVKEAGRELKADVVVTGFLYRYRERIGYDYSAERSASVAFEIHLISVADGKTIWRGLYDKTQKSLMEDVFQASSFFKGGAKWLTARQLTRLGIDETFAEFPGFAP